MLFTSPGFDLVVFITPSENPLEKARKTLHKRFPNIKEECFSDSLILKSLMIDEVMDIRPYSGYGYESIMSNLEELEGIELHPLVKCVFNRFAFITRVMDCFLKACENLSEPLGFKQDFSVNGTSKISKIYCDQWLEEMTYTMSLLAKLGEKSSSKILRAMNKFNRQFKYLFRAIDLFSSEAEKLIGNNLSVFSEYYDEHYGGQFDKELGNLKSLMSLEFGYANQYLMMLINAKNEDLLPLLKNPMVSDKNAFNYYVDNICNAFKNQLGLNLRKNKAKDLLAELHDFPSGYQQMNDLLYTPTQNYSVTTENAKLLIEDLEVENFREQVNSLLWGRINPLDWDSVFSESEPVEVTDFRNDLPQDINEWIIDLASNWSEYYKNSCRNRDYDPLEVNAMLVTRLIALITSKQK